MRISVLLLLIGCHQSSSLQTAAPALIALSADDEGLRLEEYTLGGGPVETIARFPSLARPGLSISTDGETALVLDLDTFAGFVVSLGSGAITELRYSAPPATCDSLSGAFWVDPESFVVRCVGSTPWMGRATGEVVPLSDLAGECELVVSSPHHQRLLLRCPGGDFLADGRGRRLVEIVGLEWLNNTNIVSQTDVVVLQPRSDGWQLYHHGPREPEAGIFFPFDETDRGGLGGLASGPFLSVGWHGETLFASRTLADSEALQVDGPGRLRIPLCADGSRPEGHFPPNQDSILTSCPDALSVRTFGDDAAVQVEVGEEGWLEMNVDGQHLLFHPRALTSNAYEVYDLITGELVDEWPGDALAVEWRHGHVLF